MRHLLLLLFVCVSAFLKAQNTSVTVYYDKDLKGVSDEAFATYKAVFAEPADSNYQKQYIIKYLPTGKTVMEGIYYTYDKYDHQNSKFKEYNVYTNDGVLLKTIEGDSINYVVTEYFANGKKKSIEPISNGKTHGDIIIFKEKDDIMYIAHYDNGKKLSPNDYYNRGIHTQYACNEQDTRGKLIIENVTIDDRVLEKDSKGVSWLKYTKNGLVIQGSCVKGNEYGNYWTIQFILSNYGRDWVDVYADSLSVYGIKDGNKITMEKIPMKTYMKKVRRKHANRQFWQGFAEGFVNADAGKTTSTSRVSVGNRSYRVETTYYDQYERREAQKKSQERLDAYSKYLMEERQELADNYFKTQPINPGEPVFGVQCLKLVDCDMICAELIISGQKYIFEWKTN